MILHLKSPLHRLRLRELSLTGLVAPKGGGPEHTGAIGEPPGDQQRRRVLIDAAVPLTSHPGRHFPLRFSHMRHQARLLLALPEEHSWKW